MSDATHGLAYVDGAIVPVHEARVPLLDRGYLLGDGVFETLRAHGGVVFRREDHAARLRNGLRVLGLHEGLEAEYEQAVDALLQAGAGLGDALYLRVNVTGGPTEEVAGDVEAPNVTGIVRPFKPYPMQYYSRGVRCIFAGRKDRRDPLASVKSMSFGHYVHARRQALVAGAHDAILLNDAGRIAEATTSNVFAVLDDAVHAPGAAEAALDGVTRTVVLELLREAGLEVFGTLPRDVLESADEVWLSNTTGGVVPVTAIGDAPVAAGEKGPLAARLAHAYEDLVRGA